MRVGSIDVGIKNLAYCVVDRSMSGEVTVRAWRLLGYGGATKGETVHALHGLLVQHLGDFEGCEDVLVERQAGMNHVMVCLSHCIQMFFLCQGRRVVLCDPRNKLKAFLPAGLPKRSYAETKALSVHHVRQTLEKTGQTEWLEFLENSRKRDDLGDSYAQALSWLRSKPLGVSL